MARKSSGARLYLDPRRRHWVIRDGTRFIRTGRSEAENEQAAADLIQYKSGSLRRTVGLVYFLTAAFPNYPIKIGFTEKMAALRIRALQNACPYPVYFIGHIAGTMALEREIHSSFDHLHLRGEWFKAAPELLLYIQKLCPNDYPQNLSVIAPARYGVTPRGAAGRE